MGEWLDVRAAEWLDGRLACPDVSSAAIVADLNPHSDTLIRPPDLAVSSRRFSDALALQGSIDLVSKSQVLLPVRSEASQGEILLGSR